MARACLRLRCGGAKSRARWLVLRRRAETLPKPFARVRRKSPSSSALETHRRVRVCRRRLPSPLFTSTPLPPTSKMPGQVSIFPFAAPCLTTASLRHEHLLLCSFSKRSWCESDTSRAIDDAVRLRFAVHHLAGGPHGRRRGRRERRRHDGHADGGGGKQGRACQGCRALRQGGHARVCGLSVVDNTSTFQRGGTSCTARGVRAARFVERQMCACDGSIGLGLGMGWGGGLH